MPSVRSVKGARTRLMSFQRARRLAKQRHNEDGQLDRPIARKIDRIPNPHYGYRRTTAAYAEAVARPRSEIIQVLDTTISRFFRPARLGDERIRLFLDQHRERTYLDGMQILLYSYVADLWPHLRKLSDVREAFHEALQDSPRFPPLTTERRATLVAREKAIERRRLKNAVPKELDSVTEEKLGVSFRRAAELIGYDHEKLSKLACMITHVGEENKLRFCEAAEIEYIGLMSLLACKEHSVLGKYIVSAEASDPPRVLAHQRWELLISKVADGSLVWAGGRNLPADNVRRQIIQRLARSVGTDQELVISWITTHLTAEKDKDSLDCQLELVLGKGEFRERRWWVAQELSDAASEPHGKKVTTRSAVRKGRAYCELARIAAAKKEPGHYWTLGEERALGAILGKKDAASLDVAKLQKHVPLRSAEEIQDRLTRSGSAGVTTLIDAIEAEIRAASASEADAADEETVWDEDEDEVDCF